ncbi:tetratricopeptide repeat protein [Membranihabitans marinus]
MSTYGQYSYKDLDDFKQYRQALEMYNKNAFAQVIPLVNAFLKENKKIYESEFENIRIHAELIRAQSALYSDQPDGEELLVDFIETYQPDPQANEALFNLADHYFRNRKFDQAIKYYGQISTGTLNVEQYSETIFKLGYSHFVKKDFDAAIEVFAKGQGIQGPHYTDINYYYGLCAYFQEDYRTAIASWKIAEQDNNYKKLIPYYLTQIYFANGQYDELISYALPFSSQKGIKNQKEINHLIGQSYFELGQYKEAQPYLEEYEASSGTMRAEDFYQLAYVQYKNEDFAKAIPNFKELSNENNTLGQTAMYYLAESYLREGDRASARNAFYNVVQFPENLNLRENALLNYAKLSAELEYDVDAINAFSKFLPTSQYYAEAQDLMAEVLINTKNYQMSIEIMEKLDQLTPALQKAYQTITLNQAKLDIQAKKTAQALVNLDKSLKYTPISSLQSNTFFWQGELLNREGEYAKSESALNKYFALAKASNNQYEEFEVSDAYAHYIQGYNYLKNNEFTYAIQHFEKSISSQNQLNAASKDQNSLYERIEGDAYIRIGDCYFKQRNYSKAIARYNTAISKKVAGYDYAIYQNSQIHGLTKQPEKKLEYLDQLIREIPSSTYADEALLEQADTYIEMGKSQNAILPLQTLVNQYKGKSNLINKAYFKLGLLEYNLGNSSAALANYQLILKNNPTSEESQNALAAIEEIYVIDQGNTDAYFKVLESIPGMKVGEKQKDSLQYSVANTYYINGQYPQAVAAYTEYLKRYGRGFYALEALYNRAESNVLIKDFGAALQDYEAVVAKGSSSFYNDAVKKAAIIAFNDREEFNKALKYYGLYEALTTDKEEKFDAQINALNAAFKVSDQKAILKFADLVKSNSLANAQQKSLAHFTLGKAALETNNEIEALKNLMFVIQNSDNEATAESRYLVAKILYQQGKLAEAESQSKEAYTKNGSYPYWVAKSLLLNAQVLIKKNDLFNAKAAVEAVIDNFASDQEIQREAKAILQEITDLEKKSSRIEKGAQNGELELDYGNN